MARKSKNGESESARSAAARSASETGALTTAAGGMVLASLYSPETREAHASEAADAAPVDPGRADTPRNTAAAAGAEPPAQERSDADLKTPDAVADASTRTEPAQVGQAATRFDAAPAETPPSEAGSAVRQGEEAASRPAAENADEGREQPSGHDVARLQAPAAEQPLADAGWPTDDIPASVPGASETVAALGALANAGPLMDGTTDFAGQIVDGVLAGVPDASDFVASLGIADLDIADFATGTMQSIGAVTHDLLNTVPDASSLVSAISTTVSERVSDVTNATDGLVASTLDAVLAPAASGAPPTAPGIAALPELPAEVLGGVSDDEADFWGSAPDLPVEVGGVLADAASFAGGAVADLGFLGQSYQDDAAAHDPGGLAMTPGLSGLI